MIREIPIARARDELTSLPERHRADVHALARRPLRLRLYSNSSDSSAV